MVTADTQAANTRNLNGSTSSVLGHEVARAIGTTEICLLHPADVRGQDQGHEVESQSHQPGVDPAHTTEADAHHHPTVAFEGLDLTAGDDIRVADAPLQEIIAGVPPLSQEVFQEDHHQRGERTRDLHQKDPSEQSQPHWTFQVSMI